MRGLGLPFLPSRTRTTVVERRYAVVAQLVAHLVSWHAVRYHLIMVDYKATWRAETRVWASELLGGSCVRCGVAESLHFDHVDPSTKSFDISVGIRDGYSRERLAAELEKCQLLCHPHHLEKTVAEGNQGGGWNKIEDPQHGTAVMYGPPHRCRCDVCRQWKRDYRAKLVDSIGNMRL